MEKPFAHEPAREGEPAPSEDIVSQDPKAAREAMLERMQARRVRGLRRRKVLLVFMFVIIGIILVVSLTYVHFYGQYRDHYEGQAWVHIRSVYERIDKETILKVNQKNVMKNLDRLWLDKEIHFVGVFIKEVQNSEGKVEFHIDIPNVHDGEIIEKIPEVRELYRDDLHFKIDEPLQVDRAFEKGDIVVGRGHVITFSRYVLQVKGLEIRRASWIEHFFYKEWTANRPLERKPIGVKALLEDR